MNRMPAFLRSKRIFITQLLSFLLILFVLSFAITMLYSNVYAERYARKSTQASIEALQKTGRALEDNIRQYRRMAANLSTERQFGAAYIRANATAWIPIVESLRTYQKLNPALHDILYIDRDVPDIYSAYGVCNPAYLPDAYAAFDREPLREAFLPAYSKRQASPTSKRLIEYRIPIAGSGGAFVFQIYEDALLPTDAGADALTVFLLGDAGDVLYDHGANDAAIADIEARVADLPADGAASTYEGRDAYLYRMPLGSADASLLFCVPYESLVGEINHMNRLFALFTCGMIVLGIGLVALLVRFNYRPIRAMGGFIRDMNPGIPRNLNEAESARFAVHTLLARTASLERENGHKEQERCLLRMINPIQAGDAREGMRECERLGIPQGDNACMTILMGGADGAPGASADLHEAAAWMRQAFAQERDAHLYDAAYIYGVSHVFVAFFPEGGDARFLDRFREAARAFEAQHACRLHIAYGAAHAGYMGVSRSFVQAQAAWHERATGGDGSSAPRAAFIAPKPEIEGLRDAIVGRDVERIGFLTDVLRNLVAAQDVATFGAHCLYYGVANAIVEAVRELDRTGDGCALSQSLCGFAPLVCFEDFERFVVYARDEIVAFLQGQTADDGLYARIIAYIADNIDDPDLCANGICDAFGLSASHLSRFFKEAAGVKLSQYIGEKRLERSKVLLLSTDSSVGEIAQRLGYSQASSFIRRFKAMTGVTPTEYRSG